MTATVSSFRAAFPAFDVARFPDPQVQFYLDLASRVHNADRWGTLLDFGIYLWTAHSLTMDASSSAAGGLPGAIRGNATSMSADGLSWSRDISSAVDPVSGHWNLTTFGIRWRDLARLIGAGPLYVGAPSLYDAWLSGIGWTGPWPYPGEGTDTPYTGL